MKETYKPSWLEGMETRQEESMWPYASCVIANQNIITQNIGVLKGMARDKARNRKTDAPVILHLPDGAEQTIVFRPDGTQYRAETRPLLRSKDALRNFK